MVQITLCVEKYKLVIVENGVYFCHCRVDRVGSVVRKRVLKENTHSICAVFYVLEVL